MKFRFIQLIIAITAAVIALIIYGFLYEFISNKSTTIAALQEQIASKTETMGRIASARATLSEIAGAEAVVQNYFVPGTGVVEFINGLEAQGKAQGATTSVLSVSTGSIGTQPTLKFSLAIKGPFDAVMRTVGAIEYAPYDLSTAGFSIKQDEKNSWNANMNIIVGSMNTATSTP